MAKKDAPAEPVISTISAVAGIASQRLTDDNPDPNGFPVVTHQAIAAVVELPDGSVRCFTDRIPVDPSIQGEYTPNRAALKATARLLSHADLIPATVRERVALSVFIDRSDAVKQLTGVKQGNGDWASEVRSRASKFDSVRFRNGYVDRSPVVTLATRLTEEVLADENLPVGITTLSADDYTAFKALLSGDAAAEKAKREELVEVWTA